MSVSKLIFILGEQFL